MRRIAANYIFPVSTPALKNGIVEVDNAGKVINIIDTKGDLRESGKLEFYNGIIIPGFINTHCHLELSELKDKIKEGEGLPSFIKSIIQYRKNNVPVNSSEVLQQQDNLMRNAGIVAVADISNTNITINTKKNSKIFYYTFCEVSGTENNPDEIFHKYHKLYAEFSNKKLEASIVPHAPYSVSKELFQRISAFAEKQNNVISIHNQETESENQMFIDKTGALVETLENMGINLQGQNPTGKNSLESITRLLPKNNNIIFVHNTYSNYSEINSATEYFKNSYWCLCPLSNLYIENKLPDVDVFRKFSDKVTLGADSLASNKHLSILEEIKVIAKNHFDIPFHELIQWATLNGAKALKIENKFGSIEKGKSPGLNLITDFDFDKMNVTEKSKVKVLV